MAELFASLAEFKQHIGGGINQTVELDSLAPVIADTARRHIVPYLSNQVYEDLVANAASPDPAEEALIPYVQRALALLTMHEYAKIAGLEFGEAGMFRIETETRKTAYRYQEKEYSLYMLEKGYDALELMLKFLEGNIADYSDWGASDEAEMHLGQILNYAADVRLLLNVQCDRYTFETLRPIIAEVQHLGVEKLVPNAFWVDFQAGHMINDLSDEEAQLRIYMRSAIAHRSYEEAIRRMMVQVRNGRVYQIEEFGEQSNLNRTMPVQALPGLRMLTHDIWADRHTARWKQYIIDNASSFDAVFDDVSGGSNTDADAWHINTADEQATADLDAVDRKKRPIFQM